MENKKIKNEDEIYKMPDNKWDFYSGLPNPSSYIDDGQGDDWDEDHALDMVMNDMVKDFTPEDIAEIVMDNENPIEPSVEFIQAAETLIKNIEVIEHEVVVPSDKFELLDEDLEETRDWDVTLNDGLEDYKWFPDTET
jgi:hypothetical protein|tara:strand:- start:1639 stop:2052 length:414 start_codon:yes stop_codon:yes gene_type:complete